MSRGKWSSSSTTYHRTNINLHVSDYEALFKWYGYGWTETVRELVHQFVIDERASRTLHVPKELSEPELPFCEYTSISNEAWRALNMGIKKD